MSINTSKDASPISEILKHCLLTKCLSFLSSFASHSGLRQNKSCVLTTFLISTLPLQVGHSVGSSSVPLLVILFSIAGITLFLFEVSISSNLPNFNFQNLSKLWSVALLTSVPSILTVSKIPVPTIFPNLLVFHSVYKYFVLCQLSSNLKEIPEL